MTLTTTVESNITVRLLWSFSPDPEHTTSATFDAGKDTYEGPPEPSSQRGDTHEVSTSFRLLLRSWVSLWSFVELESIKFGATIRASPRSLRQPVLRSMLDGVTEFQGPLRTCQTSPGGRRHEGAVCLLSQVIIRRPATVERRSQHLGFLRVRVSS